MDGSFRRCSKHSFDPELSMPYIAVGTKLAGGSLESGNGFEIWRKLVDEHPKSNALQIGGKDASRRGQDASPLAALLSILALGLNASELITPS